MGRLWIIFDCVIVEDRGMLGWAKYVPHRAFMRTKRAGAKAEMSAWSVHEDKKSRS